MFSAPLLLSLCMKKTTCIQCSKDFQARAEDLVRGRARFCSLSCAAKYSNHHRPYVTLVCKHCSSDFQTKNTTSIYCSNKCASRERRKIVGSVHTKSTLSLRINRHLSSGTRECFICKWNKSVCDIHHINPKHNGGDDSFDNLTVLCPNCHRLADRGILTDLPTVSSKILLQVDLCGIEPQSCSSHTALDTHALSVNVRLDC